jgi:hypothetical protein
MSNPSHVPVDVNELEQLGFDRTEPRSGWVAISAVVMVVTLLLIIGAVTFYYDWIAEKEVYEQQLKPVAQDLIDLRNRDDWNLHHYGYIDKSAGVVRLPIDRAMDLVIEENAAGKPKYPTTPYAVKKPEDVNAAAPADANAPKK